MNLYLYQLTGTQTAVRRSLAVLVQEFKLMTSMT